MKIVKRSLLGIIALTMLVMDTVGAVNYGDIIALKSNRESWLSFSAWVERRNTGRLSNNIDCDPIIEIINHEDFLLKDSPNYCWQIVSCQGKTGPVKYGDQVAIKVGSKFYWEDRYVSAKDENAVCMVKNLDKCEKWTVVEPENAGGALGFRDWNGNHLCADDGNRIVSNRPKAASWEKWWPVKK